MTFGVRPAELLDMPAAEWAYLLAYAALNPFGPRRDTVHFGTLASVAASAWGGRLSPAEAFPSLRRAGGRADWAAGLRVGLQRHSPAVVPVR